MQYSKEELARREGGEGGSAWESANGPLEVPRRPEALVASSREVTIRYRGQPLSCEAIREPKHAAALAAKIVRDDAKEQFIALYLDGRHKPIGHSVVSVGTATASLVHPREVFQPAVMLGAVAVIVVHNHPSGDTTPSAEDCEVTKRLAEVGEILGVRLVDSLVINRTGCFVSIRDEKPNLLR